MEKLLKPVLDPFPPFWETKFLQKMGFLKVASATFLLVFFKAKREHL